MNANSSEIQYNYT